MGNFSDIYGYETIKEHLQSAISMGKVSHAYVISGGLGSGKKLIASTFAQTLQCEAGGVEPCGVCHSCVQAPPPARPTAPRCSPAAAAMASRSTPVPPWRRPTR